MTFKLIDEMDCVKGDQTYTMKMYFDSDTNTQRHEYVLNDQILYHLEYEIAPVEEPEKNLEVGSIADGFDHWYEEFGPDWRPEAF